MPRVTVILPVYNGEKYLKLAIDSILDQTFKDFELLVINDGSTDNSASIIESYKDPRIRVVHNNRNLKLIKTLNKGINLARGEYIARMDCDDVSSISRLQMQIDYLDRNPEVGLLGTNAIIINEDGKKLYIAKYPSDHFLIVWSLYFYCPIVHPSVMIRKNILQIYGGYNESIPHIEDYDLWCRVSNKIKFSNLPVPLLYLRKHDSNISFENYSLHINNALLVNQKYLYSLLGEKIDINILKCIRYRTCQTTEMRVVASQLIKSILLQYKKSQNITDDVLKLIYKDAALRMFTIIAPRVYLPMTWKILVDSLIADPFVIIRSIKLLITRIFRKS